MSRDLLPNNLCVLCPIHVSFMSFVHVWSFCHAVCLPEREADGGRLLKSEPLETAG